MKKIFKILLVLFFMLLSKETGAQELNFDYGGDLRFRAFYRQVDKDFNDIDKKNRNINQIRGRLFGSLKLFEEKLELQGKLRKPYYFGDNYTDHLNDSKLEVDLAYLKLNQIFDWPVEITLGKQELLYGEGFLTGDRDKFRDFIEDDPENFTAIKIRFLEDSWFLDGFYSKIYEPGKSIPEYVKDHDFAGLVIHYEFGPEGNIEPYLFFNDDRSEKLHNAPNKVKVWVLGGRAIGEIWENFYLKGEGCYEWGDFFQEDFELPVRDYKAWGGYVGGEYRFPTRFNPSLSLTLINFSGEEYPDSGDYNAFHPLFRSERFGELHTKYTEENKRIIRTTLKCQPQEKLEVLLEWFNYWANEKPLDREGRHDGDEIDLRLDYKFNENLSFGFFAGWFSPGNYFPGAVVTRACGEDVRTQIMGEMTFSF